MHKKRILLVEDEECWRDHVRQALAGLDVELITATDYGDGIRKLREGPYDLLIFDNTLGDLRDVGVELMQAAERFMPERPPVLVHSSYISFKLEGDVKLLGGIPIEKKNGQPALLRKEIDQLLV